MQPLLPLQELGYALRYTYESTGEVRSITDALSDGSLTRFRGHGWCVDHAAVTTRL